jgi:hypothetical protein
MDYSGGEVRYSIGVTGQIQGGFERSDVQQRLAILFKCQPEKALRLISGNPVMLKTGLDQQTADRYRQELLKAGVEPVIKMIPAPANSNLVSPSRPPTADNGNEKNAASSPMAGGTIPLQTESIGHLSGSGGAGSGSVMECPKCGIRQSRAEVCGRCGIVIAKFLRTLAYEEGSRGAEAGSTSELEELGAFVDHNFSAYRHKFQALIDNQGKYLFQWHWPAFFIPLPWLLYRKMYIHAVVLVALALIPLPFLGLALPILCGALGNYLYFRQCRSKMGTVDAMGADRHHAVASAGGTLSMPLTILSSILVSALVSYAGFHLYLKGQPFPGSDQLAAVSQVNGETGENTLGKMMALGQFLRIYMAAEKMAGKPSESLGSMVDIQRTFKLDAKAVCDEWGAEMKFIKEEGKSFLLSAGPDAEFSTQDDLSYEVRF